MFEKGGFGGTVAFLGALAFVLLLLPFFALVHSIGIAALLAAVRRGGAVAALTSLEASLVAISLIVLLGLPLSYVLARYEFPGKRVVEALLYVPLVTPPLVTGLLLVAVYGPYAFLGRLFARGGIAFTDLFPGLVLAAFYVAAPYFILTARAAIKEVDPNLERVSALLGRSNWYGFFRLTLPLALPGLRTGLALAWARAIGEFGATVILAYHPYGLPVKIWVDLNASGLGPALATAGLLLLLAVPLPIAFALWEARARAGD